MAVRVRTKRGKEVTLLNPSEKGGKFADELRYGFKLTNDGRPKLTKDNASIFLTDKERAYETFECLVIL